MVLNTFKSGKFALEPNEGAGNPGMSGHLAKVSERLHLKR